MDWYLYIVIPLLRQCAASCILFCSSVKFITIRYLCHVQALLCKFFYFSAFILGLLIMWYFTQNDNFAESKCSEVSGVVSKLCSQTLNPCLLHCSAITWYLDFRSLIAAVSHSGQIQHYAVTVLHSHWWIEEAKQITNTLGSLSSKMLSIF